MRYAPTAQTDTCRVQRPDSTGNSRAQISFHFDKKNQEIGYIIPDIPFNREKRWVMNSYERIQGAIDYIEANLASPIKLEQVASAGYFSLSHFYRIFHAFVGHSIKEYIRKRRLSEAAVRLVNTKDSLIDICLDYQFDYQESFTRAFQNMFGVTPGNYRKRHVLTNLFDRLNLIEIYFESDLPGRPDPKIKVLKLLQPMRVASCRIISKSPELDAWRSLHAWADSRGLIRGGKPYRLFGFDNPRPSTGETMHGYELWFTVSKDMKGTGKIKIKKFPGGLYAVTGTTVAEIGKAWRHFVNWQKISKYRQGKHQCFEEILSPIGTREQDIKIDLYLPIEKPLDNRGGK
jgi:AraC family transcriptional regulator